MERKASLFRRFLKRVFGVLLAELMREEVHRQLSRAATEQRDFPRIAYGDPLAANPLRSALVKEHLARAVNSFGEEVLIGDDCIFWGGRTDTSRGIALGNRVRLYDRCTLVVDLISPESGIVLGDGVYLGFGCYVEGSGGVEIGAGTIIGPNVVIVSSRHGTRGDQPAPDGGKERESVTLGRKCWIASNVVISAGVRIGDGAVVGAGSVVLDDVPPGVLVAGAPARVIKRFAWAPGD